jgi:hypothetical protein
MPHKGWKGKYKSRTNKINDVWGAPVNQSCPDGVKLGPLLQNLAEALAPAGQDVISAVLLALLPTSCCHNAAVRLWSQLADELQFSDQQVWL